MKLGDTVYIYDENSRVYKKDENGRSIGGPIYREHFRAVTIKEETSRSWIVSYYNRKIPKSTLEGCFTLAQVEDEVWKHDNRFKIIRLVETCNTEQLKQIADILGWKEKR